MGGFAWVTLATNDSYSLGALVLAHSLKAVGTTHQLAVLVTPGVTSAMRDKLALVFDLVQEVNILDSRDETNLRLLKRPELGITFTKLHCWRLTQYEKCVFLDADTLVLQNCDELFEREELSAAPDVGWPDCFNSGVYVYRPSLETYEKLIQFALEKGSFDGGDQGLLNLYFSDWAHKDISRHLPFIYNMCSTACYSYLPAFKQFGANAKIVHFIGAQKPWLQYFNTETRKVQPSGDSSHLQEVLQRWWDIFSSLIHPLLSPAMPQGQLQHGVSPSYFPPQYAPPPNPTSSADDYESAWDPWDEYDKKIAQISHDTSVSNHYIQSQTIESLNTNASHVTDQPTIHSQPQSQNTYSVQNNSFYQPVYQSIPRVPTPPPSPFPQHQVQFYNQEPNYHNLQPQYNHPQPQYYHPEPGPQNHQREQYHQPNIQSFHTEPYYDQTHHYHQNNQAHSSSEHSLHVDNQQYTHHSTEQSHHHQHDHSFSHQTKSEPFPPDPERPRSPNRPKSVPILPKECEATTTVSNDKSLTSTIEDCNKEDAGLAGAFAQLTLGVPRTAEQDALENVLRKQAWEVGNIDYLGRDSFDNIWSKITQTLSAVPAPVAPEPAPSAPAPSQSQSAPPQEEGKPIQPPVESLPPEVPQVQKHVSPKTTGPPSTPSPKEIVVPDQVKTQVEASAVITATEAQVETKEMNKSQPQDQPEVVQHESKQTEKQVEIPIGVINSEKQVSPQLPIASKEETIAPAQLEISSSSPKQDPVVVPVSKKTEVKTDSLKPQTGESKTEESAEIVACLIPQKTNTDVNEPQKLKSTAETLTSSPSPQIEKAPTTSKPQTQKVCSQSLQEDTLAPQQEPTPSVPMTQPARPSQPVAVPRQPEDLPKKEVMDSTPTEKSKASAEPAVAASKPSATAPSAKESTKTLPKDAPKDSSKVASSSSASKDSPKTKVIEATPPATPGSPLLEKTKQNLAAEVNIPDTPPPSEGGSTPTPPPRKTDKPKKVAAKPKK